MNDDLISRAEAIIAVEKSRQLNYHTDKKAISAHEHEHRHFIRILAELPPAQSEIEERKEESTQNVPKGDLISRKAAIDAIKTWGLIDGLAEGQAIEILADEEKLPPAQSEIIHCKECEYGVQDEDERWYCRSFGCQVGEEDGSGFCADAERRTDE